MIAKVLNSDWNQPIRTEDFGLRHNIPVVSYDLVGDAFNLALDDGCEYLLDVVSSEMLQWGPQGEEMEAFRYLCIRANESVWLVNFINNHHNCVSIVLDLENSLTTMVVSETGAYPKRPKLLRHEYLFGAIRRDGEPLNAIRHCFTDDLVGKKIAWDYSDVLTITHIFHTANSIRSSLKNMRPLPPGASPEQIENCADRSRRWGALLFEERARYVKISDTLYLVTFVEDNRNRLNPATGGGDLLLLVDTKRVRDVGRGFGIEPNGPVMRLVNCQGRWIEEHDEMVDIPSPYWIGDLSERNSL